MKKVFNIISVFVVLFSMINGFWTVGENETKVLASAGISVAEKTVEGLALIGSVGDQNENVLVNGTGTITINYKYGFTELLVYVTECLELKLIDDEGNDIDPKDATVCNAFEKNGVSGKRKVYHMSGYFNNYNVTNTMAQKSFELSKISSIGTIVRVEAYANFMISNKDYRPLYCSKFYTEEGLSCGTQASQEFYGSSSGRISHFECMEFSDPQPSNASEFVDKCFSSPSVLDLIEYHDRKYLVYAERIEGQDNEETKFNLAKNIADQIGKESGRRYIKVGTPLETEAEANVREIIEETIIPALITVLLICAGITIAVQGYRIVKSADEPQERQARIKALKNILVGIAIAILLLVIIRPFITFIDGKLG